MRIVTAISCFVDIKHVFFILASYCTKVCSIWKKNSLLNFTNVVGSSILDHQLSLYSGILIASLVIPDDTEPWSKLVLWNSLLCQMFYI